MTHTTKHTQGPWGVDATGQVCKRATNGSWDLIAYLDESPYYHDKFANAHLIAAAPELLEALKQFVDYYESMQGHKDNSVIRNGKAAINKAEGREG